MKKILFLTAMFVLAVAMLQSQDKAVLSTYRISPKPGKDAALRKAIASHVAKYHTGNWKWRVFGVLSGADEGSYQLNEGPNSWTDLEGRKELSEEHTKDYETNILPLVEKTTPNLFLTYQRQISSDSAIGPLKKALLRHYYLKPGKGQRLMSSMAQFKKVWDKLGLKVAAWGSFYSGQPELVIAYRLPNGFVDLERPMGKEIREAFDEMEGTGAYARYLEDLDQYVERLDEEVIELLPELSSK